MPNKQKSSGGGRKKGRSKKSCETYRLLRMRERNKRIKQESYFKKSIKHIQDRLDNKKTPEKYIKRLKRSLDRLRAQRRKLLGE